MKVRPPGTTDTCPSACRQDMGRARSAFTLVEMLVVTAVIALVIGLAGPAYNALTGANNLKRAIGEIAGTLEQARAYAVANNTYTFVGIGEFDVSVDPDTIPQVPTKTAGDQHYGRVAIAVIASKNGLLNFDPTQSSPWDSSAGYNNGANFAVVGKVATYENVHILALDPRYPPIGKMAFPPRQVPAPQCEIGDPACTSATPFTYFLGSLASANSKYYFRKVMVFDPQGTVRMIASASDVDNTPLFLEMSLQPSHGTSVYTGDDINNGTEAAIQIEGMTGAVTIYRR